MGRPVVGCWKQTFAENNEDAVERWFFSSDAKRGLLLGNLDDFFPFPVKFENSQKYPFDIWRFLRGKTISARLLRRTS